MKKLCLLLQMCILFLVLPSCSYQDIDRTLYITAIVVDLGKDEGTYDIYFEAFRPSASQNLDQAEGERIIYGVESADIMVAADELTKLANLEISFAQTKMLLFTKTAAEKGIDEHLNLFHHIFEFTIRTYLGIWDSDPKKFEEVELKGEKFLGVYLRTHIDNAEEETSHTEVVTMLDIMNAAAINGKVITLPIIKPIKQGETQLIDVPGIALIRDYRMVGEVPSKKANFLLYINDKVKNEYIDIDNPDAEGSKVVLYTMSSKTNTQVNYMNERMQIKKKVEVDAILLGSQKTFTADDETINEIKLSIEELFLNECMSLYEQYASQGVDIFNLGEAIYRKYPYFDQNNLFDKIDFSIEASYSIKGTNYKLDFNRENKHNQNNK